MKIFTLLLLLIPFLGFSQTTDLFISEYGEGTNTNKYIEIYNGTGASVDLSIYALKLYNNGALNPNATLILSGTLAEQDVYVVAYVAASAAILSFADATIGGAGFNGNDAVILEKNSVVIDVIGTVGTDPGSSWTVAGDVGGSLDKTLTRKSSVCSPNANWTVSAGADATTSEWIVGAVDDITNLGTYTSVCNNTPVSCLPSYVPTNGLVGYWPFCGNANDESGNGNDGVVNGATLATDRFGNADKAYNFDGNNFTNISIANNPNNSLNLTQDFTISSWFNSNSMNDNNSTVRSILMKSGDGVGEPNGYSYGVWAGTPTSTPSIGTVNFQAQPNNNSLTYPIGTSGDVQINQWYNFIVTYTKNDNLLKYFLNGILIDIKTINFDIGINSNDLWIGSQPSIYSTTKTFDGKLDDIGIWNRALTQQEITNLYTETPPISCLPSYVPTDGLVGYWPFCGNANDESGNGNNGTVNGATLTTDRNGNAGKAYSFDGVNNSIEVSHQPIFNMGNNYTISAWFNLIDFSSVRTIVT